MRWLAGETPRDVVDLGAGTGKLTRSLVALGHRVTAVEPLEEMLDELRRAVPDAVGLSGSAEAIPLARRLGGRRHVRAGVPLVRPAARPSSRSRACFGPAGGSPRLEHAGRRARHGSRSSATTVIGRSEFRTGVSPRPAGDRRQAVATGPSSGGVRARAAARTRSELRRARPLPQPVRGAHRGGARPDPRARRRALRPRMPRTAVLAMPYVTECFRAVRRWRHGSRGAAVDRVSERRLDMRTRVR